MKAIRLYSLFLSGLMLMASCTKINDISPEQEGIEFRLAVFDNDGNRTNVLKQGEDFWLILEVVNNSQESIYLDYGDYMRVYMELLAQHDFLLIYQVDPNTGEQTAVGRPYDDNFKPIFPLPNLPPQEIPSKESGRIWGMKWLEHQNRELPEAGKYFSSLKLSTTFSTLEGEVDIETDITFVIQ